MGIEYQRNIRDFFLTLIYMFNSQVRRGGNRPSIVHDRIGLNVIHRNQSKRLVRTLIDAKEADRGDGRKPREISDAGGLSVFVPYLITDFRIINRIHRPPKWPDVIHSAFRNRAMQGFARCRETEK